MNRHRTLHATAATAMALAVVLVGLRAHSGTMKLSPDMPVTLRGISPVRIGMSLTDVEEAIGDTLPSEYTSDDKDCGYTSPRHGPKMSDYLKETLNKHQ